MTASNAAFANNKALGLAKPISSEADITNRRAMNAGSSPPSTIRANQYKAPSGSLPRMDLMKADIIILRLLPLYGSAVHVQACVPANPAERFQYHHLKTAKNPHLHFALLN